MPATVFPRATRGWAAWSVAVAALLIAWASSGSGLAGTKDKGRKGEAPAVSKLAIELILPAGHRFKPSDTVEVEVLFRNTSKEEVKIAIAEGNDSVLFFDFLIVGHKVGECIISNVGNWYDPSVKAVKLITLRPGATYRAKVKGGLQLGDHELTSREGYSVMVIYRDYLFGHGMDDEKLWKGVVTSPLVPLSLDFPAEKKK